MKLKKMLVMPESIDAPGIDAGSGPYPLWGMILLRFLKSGMVFAADKSQSNLEYQMHFGANGGPHLYRGLDLLGQEVEADTRVIWREHGAHILRKGGEIYGDASLFYNTLLDAQRRIKAVKGDIYTLGERFPSRFGIGASGFCAESITTSKDECLDAWRSFINSLRIGAPFVITIVLGSTGYSAGEFTFFPAVNLTIEDVVEMFAMLPVECTAEEVRINFREGHGGTAIVVGRRIR
ncbi:hypothetical protein GSM42_09390 [Shimazuella sp. KC615]|uniref:Uncharacterized protein n=2 Tax=Shimazuella alba TaxID=2690964 RepID=A0A6I4VUR9_9BACL|nr:hypothetical protein [Shimazuella alba]